MSAHTRRSPTGLLRFLPALTLVAVLTITASAEFELARTVLALPPYIAWALPVAVDSYVLAALRSGRDVVPALGVMAGSLGASMGAHLAAADGDPGQALPGHVVAPAATGIMTVLVVVAWRVHVLIEHAGQPSTPPAPQAQPVLTGTTRASTPRTVAAASVPAALRAAGHDPDPEPEPPSPTSERPPGPLTDVQILAQIGATPPSIRTLKRRYAIGQSRATRIHRAATANSSTTKGTTSEERISSSTQTTDQESDETRTEDQREKAIHESEGSEARNTHTCITDRVGESSPPVETAAPRPGNARRRGSRRR